ncbi:MAG: Gldg family protein [Clostridia bacterium]|nr:Gldg family protein [Clostridia bacterium]
MDNNKKPLFNRQAKAGTYTTVAALVLLAVLVVLNLVVSALPTKYTIIDTSANDLYTLSETTETAVKALAEPVTMYYITNASVEDVQLTTFLERFTSLNSLITLKKIDPTTHPTFLETYTSEQVSENSVVVESERRFKVVDYTEIYVEEVDYYTYLMSSGTSGYTLSFAGESAITGALDFVTTDKLPTLYTLTGHGETALPTTFSTQLTKANVAIESLSLLTMSALPEDADCVMINAPSSDLSEHEAELLTAYLEAGGHLFLLTDYRFDPATYPNLASVTAHYGVTANAGVVMEGSSSRYYQVPYYIVPTVQSHEITNSLMSSTYAFITAAHGLTVDDNVRSSLTVSPLFTTGETSFLAAAQGDQVSTTKPEGAEERSFALGVAASEEVDGGTAKLVWISGAQMLSDTTNQMVSGGNYTYLQEMVDWMCEREQVISVPAITIEEPMLVVSDMAANLIGIIITAVIPIAIAVFGCVYWLKRRRR